MNRHLPIVALHYVSDDASLNGLKPWVISRQSFAKLLDFIQTEGYVTLTFDDIIYGKINTKHSIVITFDDCPKHLWDFAIPELLKRDMKAVFYMPTFHINGYDDWNAEVGAAKIKLMDSTDIARLVEVGMEVGSHSHHHVMLGERDAKFAEDELKKSKLILESIIGKEILTLAYPYGSVPRLRQSIIKRMGYKLALSVYTPFENDFAIRRWIYDDNDTFDTLRFKLSYRYVWYRAVTDKTTLLYKKTLSRAYGLYSKLKKIIFSVPGFAIADIGDVEMLMLC